MILSKDGKTENTKSDEQYGKPKPNQQCQKH